VAVRNSVKAQPLKIIFKAFEQAHPEIEEQDT
jgi:hypothetical protein